VRHHFLVVTVKKGLKSVYIYRSYYKNKLGGPFFMEHPVGVNFLMRVGRAHMANIERETIMGQGQG